MPQGIFQGFPAASYDAAWTAAMEVAEDHATGVVKYSLVFRILEMSGGGCILRE